MISHSDTQNFVPGKCEEFAKPAAAALCGAASLCFEARRNCGQGPCFGGAASMRERGTAAEAAVLRDEPVSVQRSEQDRRERAGLRAGAFPRGGAEPGLHGTLRDPATGRAGA